MFGKSALIASIGFFCGLFLGYLAFMADLGDTALLRKVVERVRSYSSVDTTFSNPRFAPTYGVIESTHALNKTVVLHVSDPVQKKYRVQISLRGSRILELADADAGAAYATNTMHFSKIDMRLLQPGDVVFLINTTDGDPITADAIVKVRRPETLFP